MTGLTGLITVWQWVAVVVVALAAGVSAWILAGADDPRVGRLADPRPLPGEVDECVVQASCEPDDHTYSWPCVWAPETGRRWLAEIDARPDGAS
jgi:hypothetical protein